MGTNTRHSRTEINPAAMLISLKLGNHLDRELYGALVTLGPAHDGPIRFLRCRQPPPLFRSPMSGSALVDRHSRRCSPRDWHLGSRDSLRLESLVAWAASNQ